MFRCLYKRYDWAITKSLHKFNRSQHLRSNHHHSQCLYSTQTTLTNKSNRPSINTINQNIISSKQYHHKSHNTLSQSQINFQKRHNHHNTHNSSFITTSDGLHVQTDLPKPFDKILIANRGEIACRIIRTCNILGIKTVAIYSEADANSMHVDMADESYYIGPSQTNIENDEIEDESNNINPSKSGSNSPPEDTKETPPKPNYNPSEPQVSYLQMQKIIDIAISTNSQAIHPGYGFLSENHRFAKLCFANDIEFIGPPEQAMKDMGDKSASKYIMEKADVPIVPGYHGDEQSLQFFKEQANIFGYPVMLKAVAGGGGKGIRPVFKESEMKDAFISCKNEAYSGFKNDQLLIEKYVPKARHIEFQVFCDKLGNGVHLNERDCSVQRGNQKVFEESPAPGLSDELRQKMGKSAVDAALACNYVGAGTVEFLVDPETMEYFFLEMNTRLQVEHPVTEMIVNRDLVQWQLHVAAGYPLPVKSQDDVTCQGHAIEARIYAEDSVHFLPSSGKIHHLLFPNRSTHNDGPHGIRVETGVRPQDTVTSYYDAMIAKLIVHTQNTQSDLESKSQSQSQSQSKLEPFGSLKTRESALQLMDDCLKHFEVSGLQTNIEFCKKVLNHNKFIEGGVTTDFIPEYADDLLVQNIPNHFAISLASLSKILFDKTIKNSKNNNVSQFINDNIRSPWITNDELFHGYKVNGTIPQSNGKQRLTLYDENYGEEQDSDSDDTKGEKYNISISRNSPYDYVIHVGDKELKILSADLISNITNKELMNRESQYLTLRVKTIDRVLECNCSFYDNLCSIFVDGTRYDFITEREVELQYPPEFYNGEGGVLIEEIPDEDSPVILHKAKMPCKLIEILVSKGDEVTRGSVLLKTFSMKMTHEVKATCDGIVEFVTDRLNQDIAKGELLCKISRGKEENDDASS